MNECIIERWNSVVKPQDVVFHLGDFAFGRDNIHIASQLHGKKKLVLGNHDTYPTADYLVYFDRIYGMTYWKDCVLSHMPVHPNGLGARCFVNVHGHLHSKRVKVELDYMIEAEEDLNYFNVSCEQNNLTPIHYDVIRERVQRVKGE